jgi:RNA polymerase sigma-70 factor (ECF subfamily)
VYRLVVNSCLDHKRRAWRLIPIADELFEVLRAPHNSLDAVLETEMRERVRHAVEKLTPDLRMVIVLRYTEGLSYEEIAEVLSCSTGTVASRLNRAHKALERRLNHFVNILGARHV